MDEYVASDVKGLTLFQPYASLLAGGHKRIETRSWQTHYRGRLAIHAGAGRPKWATRFGQNDRVVEKIGDCRRLPYGAIIGVGELVDCRLFAAGIDSWQRLSDPDGFEALSGDMSLGRYGWIVENAVELSEPIVRPGAQSIWPIRLSEELQIIDQLRSMDVDEKVLKLWE